MAASFPHFDTHPVSVAEGFYLGSANVFELNDAELFNHSCEPNVGVAGQIVIVARRNIQSGEELTLDYDTTEVAKVRFQCRCGSAHCRGVINGSGWKDPEFVRRNQDYFSCYVNDRCHGNAKRAGGSGQSSEPA